MILHIEVTRDDLDNGLRNDPLSCPIALAVKRALDEQIGHDSVPEIAVGIWTGNYIWVRLWNKRIMMTSDKFIGKFINDYDREEFVLPFQRTLNLMENE